MVAVACILSHVHTPVLTRSGGWSIVCAYMSAVESSKYSRAFVYVCEWDVSSCLMSWLDRVVVVGVSRQRFASGSGFSIRSVFACLELVCWRVEVFSFHFGSSGVCLAFLFLGVPRLVLFWLFTRRCRGFVSCVQTLVCTFNCPWHG